MTIESKSRDYLRLRAVLARFGLVATRCIGFAVRIFRITVSNGTASSAYSERSAGFACLARAVMVKV